jgi:hypothetical protein
MAFALDAIVGSTTTSLTDGAPFKLLNARGMAGPPIRRITARGPSQHGDSDLGYRLQPREIELELGFEAATDAILDGYRDTLASVFKPLTSTPINLRVTRDTAIVRQIDVYTMGAVKIDLLPEFRPGHYHRATVRLRAPDPTWYDPVSGTASVQGSATPVSDWYLAGGAIGTAQVLMSGTAPAVGEAWSYTGTVTGSYTLAFRTEPETDNTGKAVDFANSLFFFQRALFETDQVFAGGGFHVLGEFMPAGTHNIYVRSDPAGITDGDGNGGSVQIRRGTAAYANIAATPTNAFNGYWRAQSDGAWAWSKEIVRYALFSPGLTYEELSLVDGYMEGGIGGESNVSTNVQLEGDMPDFPIIRITGPITGPTVLRVGSPSATLAFGTATTIGPGTVVEIDTRHGYKTVLANGSVNLRGSLQATSTLGDWHLTAENAQGINPIYLAGDNTGTATKLEVIYHHRYSSY